MARVKDLLYAVALRAQFLADVPMVALRREAAGWEGYSGSPRHDTRGQMIEWILLEEFEERFE